MTTVRRVLAAAAAAGGALALLAGSPRPGCDGGVLVREPAPAVVPGEGLVEPLEVARWIRDRKGGLRVLDLRSPEEFDALHLPRAERLDGEALAGASFRRDETLVFCSGAEARAAQAWVLVRSLGHHEAFVLRGGVEAWVDEVMNATIAPNASEAERTAFRDVAELSRYFGGVPRVGAPASSAGRRAGEGGANGKASSVRVRGGGC